MSFCFLFAIGLSTLKRTIIFLATFSEERSGVLFLFEDDLSILCRIRSKRVGSCSKRVGGGSRPGFERDFISQLTSSLS
jgi:hypothetical protein